jgi:myo-inositol 2-dehydrogenase/D-chiro-inositol 1-dehydrogenase
LDVKPGSANPKKQVNRVIAMGQQAVYGDLAKFGDCDNGWGMVEFANGTVLTTHLGRTLTNGYEATTRLCGTKAHTIINSDCRINGVEIRDSHGVRTLTTPDAFALHAKSFLNDVAEFADAVLDGKPLTCAPDDAYEAAKIATALQYSFRNGVPVYFDDNGLPIMETRNGKVNGKVNGNVNGATNGINGH